MEQFHWWVSLFPWVKGQGHGKCLCFGLGTYLTHQRATEPLGSGPKNFELLTLLNWAHWKVVLCPPFTFTPCALMNSSSINHACLSALSQLICLPVFPFLFHQTPTLLLFSSPLAILTSATSLLPIFIWSLLSSLSDSPVTSYKDVSHTGN